MKAINREFINSFKEIFLSKLMTKTGWGRNEIKELLNLALHEAIMIHLDKEEAK